jgi:Uma2 family endonuclease
LQTIDFSELLRLSDRLDATKPYVELIDGSAQRKVSPKTRHGFLQLELGSILRDWARGRGRAGTEWRFWLVPTGDRRTSLVPDVAFVSQERFATLEGEARESPPFAPDIAIEIRSPGVRERTIQRKIELYLAHGSKLVLDVDPDARRIVVHDGLGTVTIKDGDRFEHASAPGLSFDVTTLFDSVV